MLKINNKILCEKCFLPLQSNKTTCKHCFSGKNTDKYPTALPEGTILSGRYIVGKVLGKGGFGITYLCYDSKQDKRVAIKEYLPDALTHRNTGETQVSAYDGEKKDYFLKGAKKFFEEAKLVSRFNGNPNIIGVYEFFYENNTAYFVMEYLDGTDFKTYITENGGKLNENQVAFAADKMCDALIIVHSMGVLHRDISPDNIFICENGNIKLIDFGAARQVLGEASKSLSVILKQGFAPLEQYQKHGNQGPWTDIYALGASLYYALTGKVIDDAMTRLSDDTLELNGISPEFAAVIKKMLAIKTEDRYQSAVELKQAINSTGISFEPIIIQPEEQEPKPDPDPDPDPDPEPDPDPNPVPRDEKSFVNDLVDKLRSSKKILIPTLSVLLVCVIAAVVVVIVNGHKKAPVSESIPVVDENIANTPSMSVVENTIIATEETTLEHTETSTTQVLITREETTTGAKQETTTEKATTTRKETTTAAPATADKSTVKVTCSPEKLVLKKGGLSKKVTVNISGAESFGYQVSQDAAEKLKANIVGSNNYSITLRVSGKSVGDGYMTFNYRENGTEKIFYYPFVVE